MSRSSSHVHLGRLAAVFLIAGLGGAVWPVPARAAEGGAGSADLRAAPGADQLFWVPTLEQAEAMAKANGMPVFAMGYSLVDPRSTYTRLSEEYCSSVF